MDKDVVTVMWGEFGRTPKINDNDGGRDHWSPVMSALVAGGGLKMGQAIGATSAAASTPRTAAYTVPQVLSTIYQAIGIDPSQTFPNGSGRPMYILDDREPVTELLAAAIPVAATRHVAATGVFLLLFPPVRSYLFSADRARASACQRRLRAQTVPIAVVPPSRSREPASTSPWRSWIHSGEKALFTLDDSSRSSRRR